MLLESKDFIQVKIPEKNLSETEILESLGKASKIEKDAVIDKLKESIAILNREIKQQATKYITQRDSQKKDSKGGLNSRKKKSLKKSYGT